MCFTKLGRDTILRVIVFKGQTSIHIRRAPTLAGTWHKLSILFNIVRSFACSYIYTHTSPCPVSLSLTTIRIHYAYVFRVKLSPPMKPSRARARVCVRRKWCWSSRSHHTLYDISLNAQFKYIMRHVSRDVNSSESPPNRARCVGL